jgi:hypothetical protein
VVFDVKVDPADPWCDDDVLAFAHRRVRNDEIMGGRIVYCAADEARTGTALHEIGHAAGLEHSLVRGELMYPFAVRGGAEDFGPREILILGLMMQRRPGNRFPDHDPFRGTSAVHGERVVLCPR